MPRGRRGRVAVEASWVSFVHDGGGPNSWLVSCANDTRVKRMLVVTKSVGGNSRVLVVGERSGLREMGSRR